MAITEDASQPAVVTSGTNAALTSAAFSPPTRTLLVAIVSAGYGTTSNTATVTDSGLHTWTKVVNAIGSGANGGVSQVSYTYLLTAPGSITVTSTYTGLNGGSSLAVRVLNGARPSQAGAATATNTTTSSTVGTVSITTTTIGSVVYGAAEDPDTSATYTVNGATTSINKFIDATNGATDVQWKSAATVTPGATTLGGTWGAAASASIVAFEVLPDVAILHSLQLLVNSHAVNRAARY
jgi:hypothetical protein